MPAGVGQGDDELLARLADGDAAAFDMLFERHGDFVHNLVFRRTASWSSAEDVRR